MTKVKFFRWLNGWLLAGVVCFLMSKLIAGVPIEGFDWFLIGLAWAAFIVWVVNMFRAGE